MKTETCCSTAETPVTPGICCTPGNVHSFQAISQYNLPEYEVTLNFNKPWLFSQQGFTRTNWFQQAKSWVEVLSNQNQQPRMRAIRQLFWGSHSLKTLGRHFCFGSHEFQSTKGFVLCYVNDIIVISGAGLTQMKPSQWRAVHRNKGWFFLP